MSLETPSRVRQLQEALRDKAKAEPCYRFYLLYDKLYREDVLTAAWRVCRANGGACGVDGISFEQIEQEGVEGWLAGIGKGLKEKTYRTDAVRRVYIPKSDGKQRPLGIPTIKDRVVQTAAMLVLAPIFEVDLPSEQYAYREGRGALDAVKQVDALIAQGYRGVVDADLSGYFDTIPHPELMRCVARRISDRHLLRLIRMWLTMAVEEEDSGGCKQRTNRAKREGRGTPQGAPISPLLANLYMRRFILGWKKLGLERRLEARVVNYADDFVILCRGSAEEARRWMREIMERLKLTVNEQKTKVCRLPRESFDFLGYSFSQCYSRRNGHPYLTPHPSRKSIRHICRELSFATSRQMLWMDESEMVAFLNPKLVGWANYFCLGTVHAARKAVHHHACYRMRRWLWAKHPISLRRKRYFPDEYLFERLGLHCLRSDQPFAAT